MTRVALLLLLAGCPKPAPVPTALPPSDAATAADPRAVLGEGATSEDPWTRGRALALLIAAADEPGGGPWALVGLSDTDPGVLREVVLALSARGDATDRLDALVRRPDADPYVRAAAALRLPTGEAASAAWAAASAWEATPLAVAALAHGDAAALPVAARGLSAGDVGLEPAFFADLGASGLTALVPAMAEGADRCEEELAVPWAAARVGLGDAGAVPTLRAAIDDDPWTAVEVLDQLVALDGPLVDGLLAHAARRSGVARLDAEVLLALRGRGPSSALRRAFASADPDARRLAVERIATAPEPSRKVIGVAAEVCRLAVEDPDPVLRAWGVRALARVDPANARVRAEILLSDDAPAVRLEAAGVWVTGPSPR